MRLGRAGQAVASAVSGLASGLASGRASGLAAGREFPPLSSLSTSGFHLDRLTFHDSFHLWPRRSPGNGGKPSQPQPEPKPGRRFRAARRVEAKGRAADEAAVQAEAAGLSLSGCESGRLRKARTVSRRPSGTRETTRRDTGPSGSGPARRKAGLRFRRRHRKGRSFGSVLAGQDRVSARELRNRRAQDFGPWPSGGTRGFGRGSRHHRNRSFGRGTAMGGSGT